MMTQPVPSTPISLPRFGDFAYAETDVIEFPWGLPGFAGHRRWLLLTVETHPSFVWLQSLDDPAVAIPTADPWFVFETYDPKMPAYAFASLEVEKAEDFTLLCVVVVTPGAEEMTMNLLAPILVNLRTRRARQVPLENSAYSVRETMPRRAPEPQAAAGQA